MSDSTPSTTVCLPYFSPMLLARRHLFLCHPDTRHPDNGIRCEYPIPPFAIVWPVTYISANFHITLPPTSRQSNNRYELGDSVTRERSVEQQVLIGAYNRADMGVVMR